MADSATTEAPRAPGGRDVTGEVFQVYAHDGAQAWINAAIASSNNPDRTVLYRTVRIEFFRRGLQFVACDGTMLFRTWAPFSDYIGDAPPPMPEAGVRPIDAVTVQDDEKFASGFMRTLLAATAGEESRAIELEVCVQPRDEEPPLGDEVRAYVLHLEALGQRLTCQLYDGVYPDWRALNLGLDPAELVDGMTLSPKLFAAVGKLKGVAGVDLTFRGEERAIEWHSTPASAPCGGLLMPMRRPTDRQKPEPEDDAEQTEHGDGWDEGAPGTTPEGAERVASAAGAGA